MTGVAIGLVLISCVLHAGWNLLVKRAGDKGAFTALYLIATCVLYTPVAIGFGIRNPIPPAGWRCIGVSGCLYAVNYLALSRAYKHGDLSYAYPLARGSGPLLTVILGVTLLGERLTAAGLVGVALILAAVVVLQAPIGTEEVLRGMARAAGWALLVGTMYAAYSIVDKAAVSRVGVHPVLYLCLAHGASGLVLTPVIWSRKGTAALVAEWRRHGPAAVAVGLLIPGAYLLVLFAMAMPHAPVSYIVPLRTVSVMLGVAGGLRILGEQGAWSRMLAAVLVVAGVGLIAWKG